MKLKMNINGQEVELEGEVDELRSFVFSENSRNPGNKARIEKEPVVRKHPILKLKKTYIGRRLDPYYRKAFGGRSLYKEVDRLIGLGLKDDEIKSVSLESARKVKEVGCRKSLKLISHLIRRTMIWRLHGGKREHEKPDGKVHMEGEEG